MCICIYFCPSATKNNDWHKIYKNYSYSIWLKYRPIAVNNIQSLGVLYKTKF